MNSVVDDNVFPSTLFIEMPDSGALSGEDDAEEDEAGTGDDLHRTLLLQPCELRMENEKCEDDDNLPNLSAYRDISDVISNVISLLNVCH